MQTIKKFLPIFLPVVLIISLLSVALWGKMGEKERADGNENMETDSGAGKTDAAITEAGIKLENPRIEENGLKVTWDCVWFGSYPQAEVVTKERKENYSAIKSDYLQEGDLVADDATYAILESATDWDANGDITVDGEKYRRIRKKDATRVTMKRGHSHNDYFYDWSDGGTYRYFKYEPVKWRVLSTDGNQALLLSDVVLDNREYNTEWDDIMWETGTIRSWLNGYSASSNKQGIDYSSKNFIDSVFSAEEQSAIAETTVVNEGSQFDDFAEDGRDTNDKLFLLSESEVYEDTAERYGFDKDDNIEDKARRAKSSTYAKAMGICWDSSRQYAGSCEWWLRTLDGGDVDDYGDDGGIWGVGAIYVKAWGDIDVLGSDANADCGVRVALNLNMLSNMESSKLYTYAGTVCRDGAVAEVEPGVKAVSGNAVR